MKRFVFLAMMATATVPAFAADVGVSISVGQPGFYGRIDLGDVRQPPSLIYSKPVLIRPVPAGMAPRPVYLHVPPGYEKHWRRHCREYDACGVPVYFVHDDWYSKVYVPYYREHHEHRNERPEERHERGHDHDRDHRRD